MIHDMYLYEVKAQADSKYPWDYYKLLATVPGDQAFLSPSPNRCARCSRNPECDARAIGFAGGGRQDFMTTSGVTGR